MRRSLHVSLIAMFGALHCVLYFLSFGLWRNWAIYIESIEGIILGPQAGFTAALLGSSIAHIAANDPTWYFAVIAEPVSVLMIGFLARGKWKPALSAYSVMLSAYFISPLGRELPLWTILDILFALFMIYPAAKLSSSLFGTDLKRLAISIGVISFIGSAADACARVFLLVPCGLYNLLQLDMGGVKSLFIAGAVGSYIEDGIVVAVALTVGVPLLVATLRLKLLQEIRPQEETE